MLFLRKIRNTQSGWSLGFCASFRARNRVAGASNPARARNYSRFLASVSAIVPFRALVKPNRYPATLPGRRQSLSAAGYLRLPEEIRGHRSPQFPHKADWPLALVRDVVCGA